MAEPIRATYLIESPLAPEQAAQKLAGIVSAGTFTAVPGETAELRRRFNATVEAVEPLDEVEWPSLPYWTAPGMPAPHRRARVTVALPSELAGTEITGLLAVAAGGVFELREASAVRLLDLDLPAWFGRAHPGPQFGVEGTRRLTGVYDRPVVASIIKPNVGLLPEQTAALVAELAGAGVDFIKDDEKLTSPTYSLLERRATAVMRVLDEYADRTGKRVMFAFNISSDDPEEMVRRHDVVLALGASCVMVSINQVGFGAFNYLRRRCALPIQAHRNGWGMLTRCPHLGLGFAAYQKLWRLAGVDHLHVNGIRNKYWEHDDSVVAAMRACLTPLYGAADRIMPVVGSGMWAGQAPETYRRTGAIDLIYIAGGGIQGHPAGAGAGVRSIRQAWEASLSGVDLEDYARTHPELRQALDHFGQKQA